MICPFCGNLMVRTGSCYTCPCCGENTGCGHEASSLLIRPGAFQERVDRILFGFSVIDTSTGQRVDPRSIQPA